MNVTFILSLMTSNRQIKLFKTFWARPQFNETDSRWLFQYNVSLFIEQQLNIQTTIMNFPVQRSFFSPFEQSPFCEWTMDILRISISLWLSSSSSSSSSRFESHRWLNCSISMRMKPPSKSFSILRYLKAPPIFHFPEWLIHERGSKIEIILNPHCLN